MIHLAMFGCLLMACQDKQQQVHPVRGPVTESVYASGIVKSDAQYMVYANATGLVTQVWVTEGDLVKTGDPLLRLSDTAARLGVVQARLAADYAAAAANRDRLQELQEAIGQARLQSDNDSLLLVRQQRLWDQHIGARVNLEQRELDFNISRRNYAAALLRYAALKRQIDAQSRESQTNWEIARSSASDHLVRSVIDGKVYSVLKKKGEMTTAQTPVAIIGGDSSFLLALQVDEYDIARIRTGMPVVLTMDSYKGRVFEAVVTKIYPMMDAASKTFGVDAVFTKAPPVLYPNLTCEANIIVRTVQQGITIPVDYLLPGDLVLVPGGKQVHVVTGARDYRSVEIVQGLTEKDIILKPAL